MDKRLWALGVFAGIALLFGVRFILLQERAYRTPPGFPPDPAIELRSGLPKAESLGIVLPPEPAPEPAVPPSPSPPAEKDPAPADPPPEILVY